MIVSPIWRRALDGSARIDNICLRCLRQAAKTSRDHRRTIATPSSTLLDTHPKPRARWKASVSAREYFWPNATYSRLAPGGIRGANYAAENPVRSQDMRRYFLPNIDDLLLSLRMYGGRRWGFPHSSSTLTAAGGSYTVGADALPGAISGQNHDRIPAASRVPGTAPQQGADIVPSSQMASEEELLPHRRRGKRRREQDAADTPAAESYAIPPDASSRLTTASTTAPASSWRRKAALYLSLSKPRLTFLIVLTTAAPYCIYPTPDLLSPAITATPSLSALTLLFLTTGTALSSASANTFNMLFEPKYDAQMSRTRNRPLVRKLISSRAAAIFGIFTGITGVAALYMGCNPTTAALGAANIILYAGVYTPMKRISVLNTWVGALVGAIPPLMGWTAAAGQYAADGGWRELLFTEQAIGGWLLAALLFAWQFPHFNALSHTIAAEYKAAGYRMLAFVNPARNARVALRYSLLMFPVCYGLAACGIVGGNSISAPTTVLWAVGSTATNGWMSYQAVRFWWHQGGKGTARSLFWASVWHLPVLLVLAMALKRGIWQRMAESVGLGAPDETLEDDLAVLESTEIPVRVEAPR